MALEQIGVEATIQGLSSFRRGINQMEGDVRGFGRSTDGLLPGLNSMGDSLLKIGGIAAGAVVAGLAAATGAAVAFAGGGIKAAVEMEDQMGNIAAVMNTTKAEIQPLADLILELGIDPGLKVTAEEAAQAIELLARNGLDMTEIMEGAAKATVLLANATGAEFGNAADIATDAMAIFGIEAKDMLGVVDSIVSVTTNSKFTIDDFSLAIRNGGAAAAMMNVSLEDFNTVIAATAEEMGSGMRAGTGFRNFITRLTPSTEGATDAMKELGLVTSAGTNMFFDANGELKDMAEVSGILQDALYGTSTAITEVGGRTAAQNQELARLQGIYARTLTSINDYELGIKGAGLSEEARIAKLEDLNLQLANTAAAMGPLNAIQGEFVETTKQLTDAERSAALELIFGQDALGTAIGLANEGEESFRALAESMSETDAAAAALERMDSVAGVMEILGGVIDTVQLQIGQAFLPLIRDLADVFLEIANDVGPKIVEFFSGVADGIGEFVKLLQDGESPLDAFLGALDEAGVPKDFITELSSIATSIQEFVDPIIEFVTEHSEAFKGALVGIGAVLASGVIVSVLGTIGGLIAALVSPIGLLVIGFAAIGAGVAHFGGIQQIIENIRTTIEETDFTVLGQDLLTRFLEGMSNFGETVGTWANNLYTSIITFINDTDWTEVGTNVVTFIGDAIVGAVGLIAVGALGIYNFFVGYFSEFDWAANGINLINAIIGALSGFAEGAIPVLEGWWQSFVTWFQSVDWAKIGLDIVNFVITGLTNFATFVGETLSGWWTTFTTWVDGIDWVQIGLDIVTFVIDGLVSFTTTVVETLATWWQAFADWVNDIDWEQLGYDIVTFIIDAFDFFNEEVPETLENWAQEFIDWVIETDWKQMAIDLIDNLVSGLKDFWDHAEPEVDGWWESIKGWFEKTDWSALAQDLIDGLIAGIENGAEAVWNAIQNMIKGGETAARDAAESQSPSKVFMRIGTDIGLGLIQGIDAIAPLVHESILMLFDIGRDLGSIGSGFASQLKNDVFPQMEEAIAQNQQTFDALKDRFVVNFGVQLGIQGLTDEQADELNRLRGIYDKTLTSIQDYEAGIVGINLTDEERIEKIKALNDQLAATQLAINPLSALEGQGGELTQQKLIDAYFQAVHSGNEQMKNDILQIWAAQNQLNGATAEYEQAQASILALQKAQQDLAFLQQQQELLDLITEHGLNASEILGGLELGLGADTQGLVEAMTRAIQAIIDQANDQLQIASPSNIFKEIGKFITSGLAEGISQTATNPAHAMESMLARMTPGVGSQAAMPSVINQPSTTTITKTANVDMTGAQISNDVDMQVLGEFILQKVAEAI